MSDNNDSVQPVSSSPPPPPQPSSQPPQQGSGGSNFVSSLRHDLIGGGPSSRGPATASSPSPSPENKSTQRGEVAKQAEQIQKANQIPGHPEVGKDASPAQCPFCKAAGQAGQS
ncbi:MAG: hypothetical protein ACYCW6_27220 [Candidatus Xenobia bacterium]